MGDRLCDANGFGIREGAVDMKFDDMRDALAVGYDLACERGADLAERRGEFAVRRAYMRTTCA